MKQNFRWYEKARALMAEHNILIQDVADTLGLTPGAVGHYLAGQRDPRPDVLKTLAKRIGVSVSELIEDDPAFARDAVEAEALAAMRAIKDESRRAAAIAMLKSLADTAPTTEGAPP